MKKLVIIVFGLFVGSVSAQQSPLSNIYNSNRILLNPGSTGDQKDLSGFINHRNQWVGNSGSPTAQFVGLHSMLTRNVSLGGVITKHKQGLLRQTSAQLNYAYSVAINDEHKLRFGLGATLHQHGLDLTDAVIEDPSEYGLNGSDLSGFAFNSSVGVVYNWRELEVGVALPNFLPFGTLQTNPNDDPFNTFETELITHASWRYAFNNGIGLQPLVVARIAPNTSYVLDNWIHADFKKLIWLGLGYRTQIEGSFMATAGTWLTKNINFNYSYEYSNSPYGALSIGTHELSLGFLFGDSRTNNPFIDFRENKEPKRYEPKEKKKKEKSKNKKTITIITEGYEDDEESPDIEFKVKPKEGDVKDSEVKELKSEFQDIKSRLDKMLLDDTSSKESLKDDLNAISLDLSRLLEKNKNGNTEEVSDELKVISSRLKKVRAKVESK